MMFATMMILPTLIFLALVVGLPVLVWRVLSEKGGIRQGDGAEEARRVATLSELADRLEARLDVLERLDDVYDEEGNDRA